MEVFEAARRNNRPVLIIIDTLEDENFAMNTLANQDLIEIAVRGISEFRIKTTWFSQDFLIIKTRSN